MKIYKGKKYSLTDAQVTKLARLCVQEQGAGGAAAEASQMANNYEINGNKSKYPTLYDYVRNSGWYYKAAYYMDHGSASQATIDKVRDVLVNGNRVLPLYVDEHDCISDIAWIKNNGREENKSNRGNYIPDVTVIHNKMGSTYTFFRFPAPGCDPFGYTKAPSSVDTPSNAAGGSQSDDRSYVVLSSVKLPEISRGDCGEAVRVWQAIVGVSVDGDFGYNTDKATKAWQKENGLTADGIVGKRSWSKGMDELCRMSG